MGLKSGKRDWTKISREDEDQGWDFAGQHDGEFAMRVEVSHLCAQESAFKFNQARKELSLGPVQ